MTEKVIIRDFAGMQEYRGSCADHYVTFRYGDLAVDMLSFATEQELFAALVGSLGTSRTKAVVSLLREEGLLWNPDDYPECRARENPDAR